jgi:D-3-phosphoglycerate dehydrogenase / 2-oxoglutarate reductase
MKIAILDKVHPLIEEELCEKGWQCVNLFEASREELKQTIHSYQGIILRSRIKMDEDFLKEATSLQFIGRPGAGLENVALDYCEANGIKVFRSPEGNRAAVAEHAIGMLLSLFNKLKKADTEVRKGVWLREENRGVELRGKTIGIIGYGYMGKAFAQRLLGFGVQVIAYDKYLQNFGDDNVTEVSLQTIFEEAEVVSLHTPLTTETIGLVNSAFLKEFKKPIYFINTARGQSVVTKAIVDGIKAQSILGACLDVSEYESSTFTSLETRNVLEELAYLYGLENVVLTPHIAGWTHEAKFKMADYLVRKIVKEFN